MKAKEIQDLIDYIAKSGLDEVNIETEEFKIAVKKNSGMVPVESQHVVQVPAAPAASQPAQQPAPAQQQAPDKGGDGEGEGQSNYVEIKSPMIGTFYTSPSPDAPQFVEEGDIVKVGQTVCIVEAMKLFNEIESEVSGRIVKILLDNASPVEFDQPLFLVDPS